MITATLTNVTKENDQVSFYVQFSNGQERNYRYPLSGFLISQATNDIKSELERFNAMDSTFDALTVYTGKTYKLTDGKLTEVK